MQPFYIIFEYPNPFYHLHWCQLWIIIQDTCYRFFDHIVMRKKYMKVYLSFILILFFATLELQNENQAWIFPLDLMNLVLFFFFFRGKLILLIPEGWKLSQNCLHYNSMKRYSILHSELNIMNHHDENSIYLKNGESVLDKFSSSSNFKVCILFRFERSSRVLSHFHP